MRLLPRKIMPFAKIIRLERPVTAVQYSLRMALKQQRQRPASGANINRLPEAIEHQHMLVERGTHNRSDLPLNYTKRGLVSIRAEGCSTVGWAQA